MTCTSCGADVAQHAAFCGTCGTPLGDAPATPVDVPPVEPAAPQVVAPVDAQPAPAPPAMDAPVEPPVIIRRGMNGPRLLPREVPPAEQGVTVSRSVLRASTKSDRTTDRERKIAGDLPEWEPLPPGELLVRRQGS